MIFRGGLGGTAVELHHRLVVPVHEIHLEPLNSHLGIHLARALHILVGGQVARPEDEPHVLAGGVLAKHGQVDLRHHLEEVRLLVDRPALVQNHIFYPVLGGEIYIIFIGVVVDAGAEVDAVEVPGIPPVPGHLSGPDPAEIGPLRGFTAEEPGDVAGEQVLVFFRDYDYAPGEGLVGSRLGDVVLPGLHQPLQHVVPALLDVFGIGSEHGLQPGILVIIG